MRKTTKIMASLTAFAAGLAGLEHGLYEIFQKDATASSLIFASMGAPCDPAIAWNACEPAMSIVSNFFVMGVFTIMLSIFLITWSLLFIQRPGAGWVIIVLSILLLLFGGGFFPPLIGLVSGFVTLSIHKPISSKNNKSLLPLLSLLWPWPFVYFLVWSIGQFIIGRFFNSFLKNNMLLFTSIFMMMLALSVITAHMRDKSLSLSTSTPR